MSTLQERYVQTMRLVNREDVTIKERLVHLYYWARFELAIRNRNLAANRAAYYSHKLNVNLDVFNFRQHLRDVNL